MIYEHEPVNFIEPSVIHKPFVWLITKMAFPHAETDENEIMTCVRKWRGIEFSYMQHKNKEYFYIGIGKRTLYRREIDHSKED